MALKRRAACAPTWSLVVVNSSGFFIMQITDTARLVACARGWIGTRFHHQGRQKATASHKGGVDCLGLLVGVARELGLKDRRADAMLSGYDARDYGHIPDGIALQNRLAQLLCPIDKTAIREGDIGLFRFDGNPQHVGIIGEGRAGLTLIHAYAPARKVVETTLDESWKARLVAVFRVAVKSVP